MCERLGSGELCGVNGGCYLLVMGGGVFVCGGGEGMYGRVCQPQVVEGTGAE